MQIENPYQLVHSTHHQTKKNIKLTEHITTEMLILLTKKPKAGILIGGDRNKMLIEPFILNLPKCKQILTKPTLKEHIYGIIITNMASYYTVPIILPPVQPDIKGYSPGDHKMPLAMPLKNGAHHKCEKNQPTDRFCNKRIWTLDSQQRMGRYE